MNTTAPNMQELTGEEKSTVLGMYLNAECSVPNLWDRYKNKTREIKKVKSWIRTAWLDTDSEFDVQLLLTPLSKITDEHKNDVALISGRDAEMFKTDWVMRFLNNAKVFQYLILKGYAVPLWFGINHWANHRDAIQLGIAIEKQ